MRHHFHRCAHLRVIQVPASELAGNRRGAGPILEELCDAKGFTPCWGLVECDVLSLAQKRDLLVTRATRLREEGHEGLAGVPEARTRTLHRLRERLERERERIVAENRSLKEEAVRLAAITGREEITDDAERAGAELSLRFGNTLERLRVRRLDAIDRALDAMDRGTYGSCAVCDETIDLERLEALPDTRLCIACARQGASAR